MAILNLNKREKVLAGFCIAVVGLAIVYNLVVEPLARRWEGLGEEISARKASLIKKTRLANEYEALETEYVGFRDFIETSSNEEEAGINIIGEIENISKKSACRIINAKPRSSKKLGNYKEISVEVTAKGTTDELTRFLYGVEASPEYLTVKQFTIKKRRSGRGSVLSAEFLITKIIAES
jgi:Tfp pilus assembly protein PilO